MSQQHTQFEKLLQDSLLKGVDIGVLVSDQNDIVQWSNSYFCNLLKVTEQDIQNVPAYELLNIDPVTADRQQYRIKVKNSEDQEVWLTCLEALSEKDGETLRLRYFVDISDLQRRQSLRLAVSSGLEVSRMDPDTGVLNRKNIIQELNDEISRTRRYGNPLSAILVEHKSTENSAGHSLQTIANTINSALRWVDILGHLSPGSFLIILPESDFSAAQQAWSKISDKLNELLVEQQDNNAMFHVSFSDWQQDSNADEFIARLQDSLELSEVA